MVHPGKPVRGAPCSRADADTQEAVSPILAEERAGVTEGDVSLARVTGDNYATGMPAAAPETSRSGSGNGALSPPGYQLDLPPAPLI